MSDQGTVYAQYIERELRSERERRGVLEARAAAVVSTSAGISSVLVALLAFTYGGRDPTAAPGWAWGLVVTLVAFALAAALATLAAGLRPRHTVGQVNTLEAMRTTHWRDAEQDARNVVMKIDIGTIDTLRKGNATKSRLVSVAHGAQFLAVTFLAVTLSGRLAAW
jgi:hypothetical protein